MPDHPPKPNLRHQGKMAVQSATDKFLLGIQKPQNQAQVMAGVFTRLTDKQTQAKEAKTVIEVYDRLIPDSVKTRMYQGEIIRPNTRSERNTQKPQGFLQSPTPRQINELKKIGLPPFAAEEQMLLALANRARKSWERLTNDLDMEAHSRQMQNLRFTYKLLFRKP